MQMVLYCTTLGLKLVWNLSYPDTNGAEESFIVSEVSLFQRLKCMQEWYILGVGKAVERCPQFRGVLIEEFHCITVTYIHTVASTLN